MTKIEIVKEESINGQWKWRAITADGKYWNDSTRGQLWRGSKEGIQATEEIENALDAISKAMAG